MNRGPIISDVTVMDIPTLLTKVNESPSTSGQYLPQAMLLAVNESDVINEKISEIMMTVLSVCSYEDVVSSVERFPKTVLGDKFGWCGMIEYVIKTTNQSLLRTLLDNTDSLTRFSSETPLVTLHSRLTAGPNEAVSAKKCTLLYLFARCGNTSCFEAELARGANINNPQEESGSTAYHTAIYNQQMSIVEICRSSGADPNVKNKYGESVLDNALGKGSVDATIAVLGSSFPLSETTIEETLNNSANKRKTHVLTFSAARAGDMRVINIIMKHAGDNKKCMAPIAGTKANPLHAAARAGHDQILEFLANKFPSALNSADQKGEYPLTAALQHTKDFSVIVGLFKISDIAGLKKSVFAFSGAKLPGGCSLLHLCAYAAHYEAVKFILEPENISLYDLEQKNECGDSPILAARQGGDNRIVELIAKALAGENSTSVNPPAEEKVRKNDPLDGEGDSDFQARTRNTADDNCPRVAESLADDGCPRVAESLADDGCPRVAESLADDGCPRVAESLADDGCPRVAESFVDDNCPRVAESLADDGCPRVAESLADNSNRNRFAVDESLADDGNRNRFAVDESLPNCSSSFSADQSTEYDELLEDRFARVGESDRFARD